VALTILVSKLGLSTQLYPQPCSLKWLNNGGDLKVTKDVVISFSNKEMFKDELLCDVVSMIACHLLLGHP